MYKLILVFIALILGLSPGTRVAAQVSLQRATITTADMEASIAFYRDLLGFTVSGDARYDTPALRTMFHIPEGATPRLVLLDASDEQPRALALVSAPALDIDAEANQRHAPALVLNVSDMDGIQKKMQAAGVVEVLPPTPLNDFQGRPFGREAAYLDPSGVRIVLFELLKRSDD